LAHHDLLHCHTASVRGNDSNLGAAIVREGAKSVAADRYRQPRHRILDRLGRARLLWA
jgi:hypothetical protein